MKRPCECDLPACRLCFLFKTRADYRSEWGGNPAEAVPAPDPWQAGQPAAPAPSPRGPCRWLGDANGRFVQCPSCRGTVKLRLFSCSVFTECVPTRKVDGVASCVGCPSYQPPVSRT